MPTYEFRCPEGHEFEKFYRTIGSAEAQATCPQCGLPAERVMSATGFSFKGSGFYLTDYGKNAHRDRGTPEPKTGAPATDGAATEPKSDTKSDAKSGESDTKKEPKSDTPAKRGDTSGGGGGDAKSATPKAAGGESASKPPKKSSTE